MTNRMKDFIEKEFNKLNTFDIYWNDKEIILVCKKTSNILPEFRGKVFATLYIDKVEKAMDLCG